MGCHEWWAQLEKTLKVTFYTDLFQNFLQQRFFSSVM
jgi:hypothetical protein